MFAVVEKDGCKQAVHSKADLAYLQARGWRIPTVAPEVAETKTLHLPKKKRGK